MAMPTLEQELEGLHELEGESFLEGEDFLEGELEQEQFFGVLARLAQSPALRRVGAAAARAALKGLSESELEGEGFLEGESELEYELNPIRRIYPDAMMEHMAHAAAEAANEQAAAEEFFPLIGMAATKLLPMVAKALPQAAKALPKIMRVAPKLTKAVSNVTRALYRNRRTRPLIRTMPTIAQRTVNSLAQQAARGRPVTPQRAVRTLALQTNRLLSNPRQCAQAYRRSRALDRQAHRVGGARAPAATGVCSSCGQRVPRTPCNCR